MNFKYQISICWISLRLLNIQSAARTLMTNVAPISNYQQKLTKLSFNFSYRPALREVRWKVCDLRFLRSSVHLSQDLRRVQLRKLSGTMCHLRRSWCQRRLLLQGVHSSRERSRRMSEDRQFGLQQDRFVLRAQEVRLQAAINLSVNQS